MPKVLRIINRLNLGGPTYNAAYLTRYLPDDYETMLVAGMRDQTEASSEFITQDLGLEPFYIKEMYRELNFKKDRQAYKEIVEIIKKFRPDVVHTHAAKAGALGRLAAHNHKVPVILHTFHGHVFHSYFSKIKTRAFLEIERYLARISSGLIAISPIQKKELCEEFAVARSSKFEVIPLGFDLDRFQYEMEIKRTQFRKRYNVDDNEIVVMIVGRLVPIKNHWLFLHGVKKLMDVTTKKVRAFIVGDGEERASIEAIASSLNLDFCDAAIPVRKANVTFTSWIKEIDEANAGADIVTLTSHNEGTPVSLIEAQAANKAIVSTNVGGISDIVVPGKTALLSEKNDVDGFANNLIRLVEDDDFRKSLGAKGHDYVYDKFSYKRLVGDMDRYYKRLLEQV